jgi:hypothetical protein
MTSRREGRRDGRGGGGDLTLEQRFMALFTGGAARFEADRFAESGGNVVAFVDYADPTHTLAVDVGTLPVPTPDATLSNALSATFSAHRCRSSRAASAWRYLHDGTGCEAYMVAVPTNVAAGQRVWFATNPNTALAGDTGAEIFSSADAAVLGIANNGVYPIAQSLGAQLVSGTATVLGYSSGTAQNPDCIFRRRSASIVTGDYGSAVAAGVDPTATLGIGADTAGGRFGAFRFAAFYAFPRILTAAERTTLFSWIQVKYGIAP